MDANGAIQFRMSAMWPFLDANDFPIYFRDGSYGDVERRAEIRLADGTAWTSLSCSREICAGL